jgi:hypothetical protein
VVIPGRPVDGLIGWCTTLWYAQSLQDSVADLEPGPRYSKNASAVDESAVLPQPQVALRSFRSSAVLHALQMFSSSRTFAASLAE